MDNPFVEAIGRERRLREEAYLGTPHFICGIPLKQITPRILAVLFRLRTPFLTGGTVAEEDVLRFLWACHQHNPMREEKPRWFRKTQRQKFLASINGRFDFHRAEDEIDAFLESTFLDAPDGKPSRPYVCSIAWLEFSMSAKPFCWSREYTLNTPLRIIYQLIRCRAIDNGASVGNRLSDPVMQQALNDENSEEEMQRRAEAFRAKFTQPKGDS